MGDFGFVTSENIAKNTELCQQARKQISARRKYFIFSSNYYAFS
jgi:hypothetical protein